MDNTIRGILCASRSTDGALLPITAQQLHMKLTKTMEFDASVSYPGFFSLNRCLDWTPKGNGTIPALLGILGYFLRP